MRDLKLLGLSTYAGLGGAGKLAIRTQAALRELDLELDLVSQKVAKRANLFRSSLIRRTPFLFSRMNSRLDGLIFRILRVKSASYFSLSFLSFTSFSALRLDRYDVVLPFWVNGSFISMDTLRRILDSGKPVIWTLCDMWPFTGGCHYSGSCMGYAINCESCPQLMGDTRPSLSARVFKAKLKWNVSQLIVVAPTPWMKNRAQKSALFREVPIKVIPHPVDGATFNPRESVSVRIGSAENTSEVRILYGADCTDPRKGFQLLRESLVALERNSSLDFKLTIFGPQPPHKEDILSVPVTYVGPIEDDQHLASAYFNSDIFLAPYLEDNLPQTVLESLSCGTPVVAFSVGGIPEFVEHGLNGYLARPFDTRDFAHGIEVVARQRFDRFELHRNVQSRVGYPVVAKQYREVILEAIHRSQATTRP